MEIFYNQTTTVGTGFHSAVRLEKSEDVKLTIVHDQQTQYCPEQNTKIFPIILVLSPM